jgi:hypothetical protein
MAPTGIKSKYTINIPKSREHASINWCGLELLWCWQTFVMVLKRLDFLLSSLKWYTKLLPPATMLHNNLSFHIHIAQLSVSEISKRQPCYLPYALPTSTSIMHAYMPANGQLHILLSSMHAHTRSEFLMNYYFLKKISLGQIYCSLLFCI